MSEESSSQRRDEGDFDEETYKSLECCNEGLWITWLELIRKKATTMKSRHAYDDGLKPGEMIWPEYMMWSYHIMQSKQEVGCGESNDHEQVSEQTTKWFVSIASKQIEKP